MKKSKASLAPAFGCVSPNYTMAEQARKGMRIARMLSMRLRNLAHIRQMILIMPGGFVTPPMAARILCISRARVNQMIQEGRLPCLCAIPGSESPSDRIVPVDALLACPTGRSPGRPSTWRNGKCTATPIATGVIPYYHITPPPNNLCEPTPNLQQNFDFPGQRLFPFAKSGRKST